MTKHKQERMNDTGAQLLEVASIIAKGEPPDWLVEGLEHFKPFIQTEPPDRELRGFSRKRIHEMNRACDVLLRWLPTFDATVFGEKPEVETILKALPSIKIDLQRLSKPRKGNRPNVQREVCAAVILEAWALIHGKSQHRSTEFEQACSGYWHACGGGGSENWREIIERALRNDHIWVRKILSALDGGE
jgi:hypothetical protein